MTHTSTITRTEATRPFAAAPSHASAAVAAVTTRGLLACGVVAGTLFIALNVFQILLRQGFDITRHALTAAWVAAVALRLSTKLVYDGAQPILSVRSSRRSERGRRSE